MQDKPLELVGLELYGSLLFSPDGEFMLAALSEPQSEHVQHVPLELGSANYARAIAQGRRVVAAWLACQGVPTADLQPGMLAALREAAEALPPPALTAARRALTAATTAAHTIRNTWRYFTPTSDASRPVEALIAFLDGALHECCQGEFAWPDSAFYYSQAQLSLHQALTQATDLHRLVQATDLPRLAGSGEAEDQAALQRRLHAALHTIQSESLTALGHLDTLLAATPAFPPA